MTGDRRVTNKVLALRTVEKKKCKYAPNVSQIQYRLKSTNKANYKYIILCDEAVKKAYYGKNTMLLLFIATSKTKEHCMQIICLQTKVIVAKTVLQDLIVFFMIQTL